MTMLELLPPGDYPIWSAYASQEAAYALLQAILAEPISADNCSAECAAG